MRLIAAALLCVGLLGSMALYLHALSQRHVEVTFNDPPAAEAVYSLEITPGYPIGSKDAFALDLGDDEQQEPLLSIKLAGEEVFATSDSHESGKPIRVEAIQGLKVGSNALVVKATVSDQQPGRSHPVRVQVFRNHVTLSDHTLWSNPEGVVSEEISVLVAPLDQPEEQHDHD
jgi:hypothetical protein